MFARQDLRRGNSIYDQRQQLSRETLRNDISFGRGSCLDSENKILKEGVSSCIGDFYPTRIGYFYATVGGDFRPTLTTESYAATSTGDLNELYKRLSWKTSKTLLYPYVQPDITGRSNQLIELRNADGTINQALFLIDSNAYTGDGLNKYDFIHDDQVEWYKEQVLREEKEEGHVVPSMIFFHIPLQEYKEAYKLYESGSDEVKYYFGSNDEEMMDKVCCSEYPSKLFDTAKELGSTTGFFCGHDHYNNMSLEYKGMRLTYGMSIDYLAMPGIARDTKQRGATLITVHDDGSEDIEQVPLQK